MRKDIPISVPNGLQTDQNCESGSRSVKAEERRDDISETKERTSLGESEQVLAESKPTSQVDATAGSETAPASQGTSESSVSYEASDIPKLEDQDPSTSTTVNDEHESFTTRSTIRKQRHSKLKSKWNVSVKRPQVDPNNFEDPISDSFWKDVWVTSAAYNVCCFFFLVYSSLILRTPSQTEIYRKVFHAIPDDTVTSWKQYKEFVVHHDRLRRAVGSYFCSLKAC